MSHQRVALITGAGQGLGRATAQALHASGHHIIAVDRDETRAKATAHLLDGEARACDVSDRHAVAELAASIPDGVDVLVNNAGIWRYGPLLASDPADIEDVLQVNLMGTLWCSLAFAPGMAQRGGGAIVNLSSAAASQRAQGVSIYPVSKAAIEAFTQQLAVELAPQGIRVNAVAPGMILTEGTSNAHAGLDRGKLVPLGYVGAPTDIAQAIDWLCSQQSRYVTGQILHVDGGITSGRGPS